MASEPSLIEFTDGAAMAERVADLIEAAIASALAERGRAVVALSGGATPIALYRALSRRSLAWEKVTATLVDERFARPGDAGSNETMVREAFLQGDAARARLIGLFSDAPIAEAGAQASRRLSALGRLDAAVLGMGVDGHTASWFPYAEGLEAALRPGASAVVALRARPSAATGSYLDRLTLSLDWLAQARTICLLIAGAQKKAAFEGARGAGPAEEAPVRAILRRRPDLTVCWAP